MTKQRTSVWLFIISLVVLIVCFIGLYVYCIDQSAKLHTYSFTKENLENPQEDLSISVTVSKQWDDETLHPDIPVGAQYDGVFKNNSEFTFKDWSAKLVFSENLLIEQTSFSGFDFNSVWTMDGDSKYPYPELQQVAMTAPVENTSDFAGGNGLPYNPYKIETAAQLNNVRYFAWDWFKLQNDIDLTEATRSGGDFYNDGTGWRPIGEKDYYFNGVFEGNYHSIIGLWMDNPDDGGLFAYCSVASTIENLGVARADIKCNDSAGIIAIYNGGDILRCYTSGKILGSYAGGLVRENKGLISDCYTTASVSGSYIGGLVDISSGIIERCYDAGSVEDGYDIARSASLGEGCYHWKNDKAASGSETSDPGIELTEEEFTQQDSFEYFNFDSVWTMEGDAEYPYPELAGLKHIEMPDNTAEFAGGNGLPYAPYLISNSTHLDNMRNYNAADYKLLTDIDLDGLNWVPLKFYGNLQGNNHVVSNANIIAEDWNEGFFKSASHSTISNLGIVNLNIISKYNTPSGSANRYVGLFAGKLNYSRITNCYATGSINCIRGDCIGGFTGYSDSKITDCYANADIVGEDKVGGFIGYLSDYISNDISEEFSETNNCYFVGEVDAKTDVGGFAGYAIGKVNVSGCYTDGEIKGNENVGGFIGSNGSNGTVTDCYSLGNAHGNQNIGAFVGNSDQDSIYGNCYWYSNTGTNAIGSGSTADIPKINIPEIDEVDINIPVASSILTTNFALYGEPVSIAFISTENTGMAKIDNEKLTGVALGNTEVNLRLTFSGNRIVELNGYKTSIIGTPPVIVPVTGVVLAKTKMYMHQFDTVTLDSTISPGDASNKNLIWESSNEVIVSVSNLGFITANQPGYATITVTTVDGGYTATCDVSVDTPTGVLITVANYYCLPGEFCYCTAEVLPTTAANRTVRWSSSDKSIAIVGETTGIVHAIAPGTATITATSEVGEFTDTGYIYVKPRHVSSVALSSSERTLAQNDNIALSATVLPNNATYPEVTWSSDNESVATVDQNGRVTAKSPGTATITATADGVSDTCKVTVVPAGIQSSKYIIDKPDGLMKGVAGGTTVSALKSHLGNDGGLIKVYSADGQEISDGVVGTGMTVQYSVNGVLKDSLDIVVTGDISGDGKTSVADYTQLRVDILGLKHLSGLYAAAGDVNNDGKRDISDYTLIRLDILGIRTIINI